MSEIIAKVFTTGVVMIYSFVSRKIFLEKKEGMEDVLCHS